MLTFHILSFGFVLGVTALADKDAFAWLRGKVHTLERERMHRYHLFIWAGLLSLIGSGVFLLYPTRLYLLTEFLFLIKLLFVGILVTNGILIGRLMHVALLKPFAALTRHEKLSLLLSGAISAFSWGAAALIAFVLFG